MKYVIYLLIKRPQPSPLVKFAAIYIRACPGTDEQLLELYEPTTLRGNGKAALNQMLDDGYSISNWHVVDLPEASLGHIPDVSIRPLEHKPFPYRPVVQGENKQLSNE